MAVAYSGYEDWKAKGRPGGAYKEPVAPAPAPAPAATTPQAPAPPAPAPAQPRPAPAPAPAPSTAPGGADLSGFKTYADWQAANRAGGGGGQSSQVQDWYNKQVNPNAAPTTTGAVAGHTAQEVRSNAQKLGLSEDQARFDDAQLNEWLAKYPYNPATGKFTNKYGDQVDKPSERGPNTPKNMNGEGVQGDYGYGWNNTDLGGRTSTGDASGSTGGGGGGRAGGSSSSTTISSTPGGGDMQSWWAQQIKDQGTSRYTPEAMAALEADQFSRARAQEKTQLAQANQDMATRGVSRSANQNAAVRQIGVGTGQQIMQNRAQVQKAKIDADYQDKQAAITNAQNYVNSMRDYLLRSDSNAIQREQIQAQIRLAEMNIQAQKQMVEQNYQNQLASNYALGNIG